MEWPVRLLLAATLLCCLAPHSARAQDSEESPAPPEITAPQPLPPPEAQEEGAAPITPELSAQPSLCKVEKAESSDFSVSPAASNLKVVNPPLQTRSLVTGENKTGVASQSISVPKGPGTIEGMGESFSAQASTGIATFSVPFALPAARGAAQPSLSLSYSSSGGNGVAGIGWDVAVAYIARQTDRGLPGYKDQASWHPQQDRFVYNGGQELVPVASLLAGEELPTWATGWQYFRPRVEGSYLRFFWNPSLQLWRVQDKSGVVLELGTVGNEKDAIEAEPGNASRIFRWNLKRQIDARGNEVLYKYFTDGGIAYLSDIYDTSPVNGGGTSSWAHHTRLVYGARQDVTQSFTRGWKTTRALRLIQVDVTSKGSSQLAAREVVRRYHLAYAKDSHVSLLESVQVEGRCAVPAAEDGNGVVPPTDCPRLPPMSFGYAHVGPAMVKGFEAIDTTVRSLVNSPKHSVDEQYTDLYDVNSDGLPDVVTMMPGQYGGKHALWLQGKGGIADRFGAQESMGVQGVLGASASVISKHNLNIAVLDADGDATIDLVHMPKAKTYSLYTPQWASPEWKWIGRTVTTSDQLDTRIDLGSDADEIRVFDVNGDGLVDVVKSGGTAWQVWFSLGRYPGGDGLFGSATWTGPTTAQLSMAPVLRCVPWSSTPVRFSDPDIKLADMNGDGLQDIVRVRKGDIRYWPGRGDGTFGTGPLGCAGGTFSSNSYVQMADSPFYTDPDNSGLRFDDVNGDGTADLVQVRYDSIDIWYNVDGASWQERRIIDNTPASPSFQNRVRITDMNGSGTADIVWGDGLKYKYIDLSGGKRPWLLNRVDNGLGKTTEVAYTTSTAQMLAAEKAGKPWASRSPVVLHMVSRTIVKDNLGAVGRPEGRYVTEYAYRDPYYDGRQREFRGFGSTKQRTVGDANSPTSETETSFLLGRAPSGFDKPADRWKDNPHEALKGLPSTVQTYAVNTAGVPTTYLSTGASTYVLRKLYDGKDGRAVRVAFERQSDSWLYDTSAAMGTLVSTPVSLVEEEDGLLAGQVGDEVFAPAPGVLSQAGKKRIASAVSVDVFGNRGVQVAFGAVDDPDPAIGSFTTAELLPQTHALGGEGNWAWRTTREWVAQVRRESSDPSYARRKETQTQYNNYAEPYLSSANLTGVQSLVRATGGAPTPSTASTDGWISTGATHYDAFGNVVFRAGPEGRCSSITYDSAYSQLPGSEIIHAGNIAAQYTFDGQTYWCGETDLKTEAQYDRGLGVITAVWGLNGEKTTVDYDGFGRMVALYSPRPDTVNASCTLASLKVEYHLPDETKRPVSFLVSRTHDGATISDDSYLETYAYVDGLGRTIVTLSEADPTEDGHPWVAQGLTDYDAKGAERRKYLAWWYDGEPEQYDLSQPAASKYGQQRYDAFGRAIETMGLDGRITLRTAYHALSADAWDGEDIGPGAHVGTYASEEKDGHGRTIRTTERVRVGTAVEQRHVETAYLVTGEPQSITRRKGSSSVQRTMQYTSLGQLVVNIEDSTKGDGRGWRYVYSDAGDLVGTSDARGCGINYAYDAAGRLLSEDYSPCAGHAEYTAAPEVIYAYDVVDSERADAFGDATAYDNQGLGALDCQATPFPKGQLISVTDRSGKSLSCVDGRGRAVESAKNIRAPGGGLTDRWFRKRVAFDGADRPVLETTGATVSGTQSTVTTAYGRRGTVKTVGSTYGDLVTKIVRDADGLVEEIAYGDAAETTTGFSYDDLRRLRNVTTYRARPTLWPLGATGTQQLLLQDEEFTYDRVGNPIEIRDWRIESEWEAGAKPVNRKLVYDDLYRLARIDYQYSGGDDTWVDPYAAEVADSTRPQPSPRADFTGAKRPLRQSFAYDWLGNTSETDDDAHAFYDRSLGTVTNTGYQLTGANNSSKGGSRTGSLEADYDASGNLVELTVNRNGSCIPTGKCSQHFEYEWDEVGRLIRARRWDMPNPDQEPADAELEYTYDASDNRVIKTVDERHTLYVFPSLELRLATYASNDYLLDATTETAYLLANGVRLGRVVHEVPDPYDLLTPSTRVFLELGDHLGSTNTVLDLASGELVERSTAYAYGAVESDYRPERWGEFREDYRFTGKEEDVEVGLIYFGKRFYAPLLQRWISADPLAVHVPGEADLNLYAYVHGKALIAVDPVGLVDTAPGTLGREFLASKATSGAAGVGIPDAKDVAMPASEYPLNDPAVMRRLGVNETSPTQAADHIVPKNEIMQDPRFRELTAEQQLKVFRVRENLAMLDSRVNSQVKNDMTIARLVEKHGIQGAARERLLALDARARAALRSAIDGFWNANRAQKLDVRAADHAFLSRFKNNVVARAIVRRIDPTRSARAVPRGRGGGGGKVLNALGAANALYIAFASWLDYKGLVDGHAWERGGPAPKGMHLIQVREEQGCPGRCVLNGDGQLVPAP